MPSSKHIICCVHDVTPRHMERLERIDTFLKELGLGGRYAMLVVPNFWHEWPLDEHPEFCEWLRARADEGVEMLLHGYYHRDETPHASRLKALKAKTMTASEGEFFGLSEQDAAERIERGRAMVEPLTGSLEGFVAPAWLYSEGAKAALRAAGFRYAEDHMKVWNLQTGKVLHRSPVVSYASRDRRRIAGSLVWSRTASAVLRPLPVVRHAIHPHDFDVDLLIAEIRRSLEGFLERRDPMYYRELLAG